VQTIPSLALLAFMIAIPGLGLSVRSAIVALFLYAVLPILRNTHTGLNDVDPDLIDAATGLGLTPRQMLFRVQLPLATRTIMAGVRTATVISIGVATLAAFIGAGGLGEPIVTGLYLNDTWLILSGAIPAALLALAADATLGRLERALAPR
jgi:osmoprotectant transport system permease protein